MVAVISHRSCDAIPAPAFDPRTGMLPLLLDAQRHKNFLCVESCGVHILWLGAKHMHRVSRADLEFTSTLCVTRCVFLDLQISSHFMLSVVDFRLWPRELARCSVDANTDQPRFKYESKSSVPSMAALPWAITWQLTARQSGRCSGPHVPQARSKVGSISSCCMFRPQTPNI